MPYHQLSAAKIAQIVGCHPNTVRLYEKWGLIAPVERNEKGYRQFRAEHTFQMQFARKAYNTPFPGSKIRNSTYKLVRLISCGDLNAALEQVENHIQLVKNEIGRSEAAIDHVHHWLEGTTNNLNNHPMKIKDVALELGLSADQLRSWERNGLVQIPRDPASGYRTYRQKKLPASVSFECFEQLVTVCCPFLGC